MAAGHLSFHERKYERVPGIFFFQPTDDDFDKSRSVGGRQRRPGN